MKIERDSLIARAEEYMNSRRFDDAGRYYEEAAGAVEDEREIAGLLKQAARAYDECGDTEKTVRCYRKAGQFLRGPDKAECLLECWKAYVSAIASCEWECCFEWRGDDSHDDDHEIYQGLIRRYQTEAENVLREALNIEGVNRRRIIKLATKECRRRKREDGWGSARGFTTIENVNQES
jgi:tetratricopeptide (TPR) repeat protein